jgi:uncharacterized phage protein (TIGR02218 family)
MSFATLETSQAASQPIELYEFSWLGNTLYYTSSADPIVLNSITYVPTQISRDEIVDSGEVGKNTLTLTVPEQFPVSALYGAGPPDDIVTLTIKRVQFAAIDLTDVVVIWLGRILSVDWPPLRSEIICENVFTALRAAGLHRVYTINCPFTLYDAQCKVDIGAFTEIHTADIQVGNVLTGDFNGHPDGWWAGGKLTWEYQPGFFAKRGIKNHVGTSIEITFALPNFPLGTAVNVSAGCDHTFSTCITKFGATLNYGGFPFMTVKNPWGNVSIF